MPLNERMELLQRMGLKALLSQLQEAREALVKASNDLLDFESNNRRYLARGGGDCEAVRELLAVKMLDAPVVQETGKPTTQAQRECWLQLERTRDEVLKDILTTQGDIAYQRGHLQAALDQALRLHGDLRAVLAVRTAQINYLTEGRNGEQRTSEA